MQTLADRFRDRKRPRDPAHDQDRDLAARFLEGDSVAVARLVDRHAGPIYRYISRRLGPGNDAIAAEIVEAAFEEAIRNIPHYAGGRATLLFHLRLVRLANKHLAKRRKRIVLTNEEARDESDELTALRREMLRLPARQQAALALALFEEMSPGEIAGVLRTTPSGAMRTLRSALRRIGKQGRDEGLI